MYEHKVKALVWTMALRRGEDDGPEVVRITKGKWTDTKTLTFVYVFSHLIVQGSKLMSCFLTMQ